MVNNIEISIDDDNEDYNTICNFIKEEYNNNLIEK
jgi:hypothetical protein